MKIKIDCKYLTGKFSEGVCLAHSTDKEERCEGECEDCKKKEVIMEFKSQICTTREQSERLLALGLKKETADMYLTNMSKKGIAYTDDWLIGSIPYKDVMNFWEERGLQLGETSWEIIPAWSLHRLLCLYGLDYTIKEVYNNAEECYGMLICAIEIAIEDGYFNKDYLEKKL